MVKIYRILMLMLMLLMVLIIAAKMAGDNFHIGKIELKWNDDGYIDGVSIVSKYLQP